MKSEQDTSIPAPKKPRFVPKIPQRKKQIPAATKVEPSETKGNVIDKELLAKLNSAKSEDGFRRRFTKPERTSAPVQVAFGQGSSTQYIRTFGNPIGTKKEDGSGDGLDIKHKEYVEPWDYVRTYYPVTLPLRRPYSGDPEILNEEEFGEDSLSRDNKPTPPPAEELDLMEPSLEPKMLLFQFPSVLPLAKPPPIAADSKGNEIKLENANVGNRGSSSKPSPQGGSKPNESRAPKEGCSLKDLPAGFVGKMLIYKSGKIKMKIGDSLFDVSPGVDCMMAQDVAVINAKEKHCCILGHLPKRAVVTPDIGSLLESIKKL